MQVQSVVSESGECRLALPAIEPLCEATLTPNKPNKVKTPVVTPLLTTLGTLGQKRPLERFSTGLSDLDALLGGGLPKGRIVECFGGESSGKTSFAIQCLSQIQQVGGVGALIEPENSLDPDYAKRLGVDLDSVPYGLPSNGEEAINLIAELIDSNVCDLVVLDSIAALLPKLPDGTFYDETFNHAYLLSQGLKFLNNKLSQSNRPCTLLFTNQLRFSGGKTKATGGQAMGFFASVRLEFKKGAALKGTSVGSKITVCVRKSKVGSPQGSVSLNLLSNQGLVSTSTF